MGSTLEEKATEETREELQKERTGFHSVNEKTEGKRESRMEKKSIQQKHKKSHPNNKKRAELEKDSFKKREE